MPPIVVAVVSTATPPIRWRCSRCGTHQRFRCSERFRVNSNGKLTDIWLIYRCERCEATKNVTIVERAPIGKVSPELFAAATDNDAVAARRLARDVALLRRAGARVAGGDEWVLDGPVPASAVVLEFTEPLLVRLDQVAAVALGVPRREAASALPLAAGRVDGLRLWSGRVWADRAPHLVGSADTDLI